MDSNHENTVLDLFSGLGGFSSAFEEAEDWRVVTVDQNPEFEPDICADVMDLRPSDLPDADVILASPPCTVFSLANMHSGHFDDGRPATDDAREAIALVYHTLGLIKAIDPGYWFLENPRAMLRTVLGRPTGTIHYCQYGHDWQKPTDLWGDHPPGFEYRTCSPGDGCHEAAPRGFDSGTAAHVRSPAERAKVPRGVSEHVLQAVDGRGEQTTLTEVKI